MKEQLSTKKDTTGINKVIAALEKRRDEIKTIMKHSRQSFYKEKWTCQINELQYCLNIINEHINK